jgi:hypothetical protein
MTSDSGWQQKAKGVMDVVMGHPGALPFMIPAVVGDDFPEDYFKVIKYPADFVTICARLEAQKYKTITEWRREIDLVFQNAKRYWQDGPMVILGQRIRSIFEKEYSKAFGVTVADWCRNLIRLRDKIGQLNASPPLIPLCNIVFGKKLSSQLPGDKDIKQLLAAMPKLTHTADHEELLALLKREEPGISLGEGKVSVDLISLKPSTIRIAAAFVKRKLEADGKTYD